MTATKTAFACTFDLRKLIQWHRNTSRRPFCLHDADLLQSATTRDLGDLRLVVGGEPLNDLAVGVAIRWVLTCEYINEYTNIL